MRCVILLLIKCHLQAIDVWSGACVLFVFSALLEFAFVNYASRSDRRKGKLKQINPFMQVSAKQYSASGSIHLYFRMQMPILILMTILTMISMMMTILTIAMRKAT